MTDGLQASIDKMRGDGVPDIAIRTFAAFYELRTRYDLFDHLNKWLPFLKPARELVTTTTHVRGGRLRVRASAQGA